MLEMLDKPELITQFVMLMHYIAFGILRKQTIALNIRALYDAFKGCLPSELRDFFPTVVTALSGFYEDKAKALKSFSERRTQFLRVFVKMCVPDLYPKMAMIERLIKVANDVIKTGGSIEQLEGQSDQLAEDIGALTGVNTDLLRGIFGIVKGTPSALIDFVAPVCKIDVKVLKSLQGILFNGLKCLTSVKKESSKKQKDVDDVERSSWQSLMKKVNDGEANVRELFQLVDMEGDKSGGISISEFSMLMKKLNMPMTDHRVAEIFSRCKSKNSKSQNELDIQGTTCTLILYYRIHRSYSVRAV